jgi:hypothetical protein
LIILIMLGEENKLWSSSLCSFLQPPVTSSLSSDQIFSSTPCSQSNELILHKNKAWQVLTLLLHII